MSMFKPRTVSLLVALAFASAAFAAESPHLGKPVSEADIKPWDISVLPAGSNLPPGSGTPAEGAKLYVDKGCNQCHGDNGKGGASNMLVGNPPLTVDGIASNKTIANFWAYPTTLFDYIRRAMPQNAPQSLSNDDVYAVSAYILNINGLLSADATLDASTLGAIRMPNRKMFVDDPRPDVKNPACMTAC